MNPIIFWWILIVLNVCLGKPALHSGPCIGPDCFHGQLMHGDKEGGIDHEKEDTYLRIKEELAAGQEDIKPLNPDQLGVGNMEIEIGAQGKEEEKKGPIQPVDGEVMMHGEGEQQLHHYEEKNETEGQVNHIERGPIQPIDGEIMMHGGEQPLHHHEETNETEGQVDEIKRGPIQPIDGEIMMHDGQHEPHDHAEDSSESKDKLIGKKNGPGGEEYWHGVINHGEPGKDHHHDENRGPNKYDFNVEDIKSIKGMDTLLSNIDLNNVLKQNVDEYNRYIKDQKQQPKDEGSLWDQLNQIRERYLSFGSQNQEDSDESRERRLNPLLAEWETDDGTGQLEGEDDIVHTLEVLGNTAALKNVHNNHRKEEKTHRPHDES